MSAKKKYFTINSYKEYTKHVRFYQPLTASAFIFLTLTANIPTVFTAPPQRINNPIHSIGYTALLKTLQSLLMRYTAMLLRSTQTKQYICIPQIINLPEPMKIHNFLHSRCL